MCADEEVCEDLTDWSYECYATASEMVMDDFSGSSRAEETEEGGEEEEGEDGIWEVVEVSNLEVVVLAVCMRGRVHS